MRYLILDCRSLNGEDTFIIFSRTFALLGELGHPKLSAAGYTDSCCIPAHKLA